MMGTRRVDMKVVGFAGVVGHPQSSGKDSAANIFQDLASLSGMVTHKRGFADPVKTMLSILYSDWHFYVDKESIVPGTDKSGRDLMETLGDDWGRNIVSNDIWIQYMSKNLAKLSGIVDVALISDVRYANESQWIRSNGGIVIRIHRAGLESPHDLTGMHPSRTGVFDVDHTLHVVGIDELRNQLGLLYRALAGSSGIPLGGIPNFRFRGGG
jgi:hypothetical protein